jgi:flagellar basal-body rod protein FlgB
VRRAAHFYGGAVMIDKLNAALRFHQEALNLRARRQELLASNIAHADTPNYKARDIDFSRSLTEAVERGRHASQSLALRTTSSRHLPGEVMLTTNQELLYRVPNQSSIDGNTVETDVERVQFAENTVRHETNLTVLSGQMKTLLSAIQQ